jgi:hypothetical protein
LFAQRDNGKRRRGFIIWNDNVDHFHVAAITTLMFFCELTPTLVSSDLRRGVENIVGRQISSTFRFLRVAWRLAC